MPVDTLTTPGAGLWVCPVGITEVLLELWGGGGKGGTISVGEGAGGGGGGGAYSMVLSYPTIPGNSYLYTVGSGAVSPSAGGMSWWVSVTTAMARGGLSVALNSSAGAAGGLASEGYGDARYSGGSGASGVLEVPLGENSYGGAGGASAWTRGNGVSAVDYIAVYSTPSLTFGKSGNGRHIYIGQGNGSSGLQPGGGGGGAFRQSSGTRAGGNGANGRVVVAYSNAWFKHHVPEQDRQAEDLLQQRLDAIRFEYRASLINVETRQGGLPPENRIEILAPEARLTLIDSQDRVAGSGP